MPALPPAAPPRRAAAPSAAPQRPASGGKLGAIDQHLLRLKNARDAALLKDGKAAADRASREKRRDPNPAASRATPLTVC